MSLKRSTMLLLKHWARRISLLLGVTVVISAFLLPGASPRISAQDDAPTLEILPDTQVIPRDGSVQAQLVLRNHTERDLHRIELTIITDAAVSIDYVVPPSLATLSAGGEFLWTIRLASLPEGRSNGTLYIYIHYALAGEDGEDGIPRVLVGELALSSPAEEQVDEMASVEIRAATLSINEKHSGQLFIIVSNTSTTDITVRPIVSNGPDFVKIEQDAVDDRGLTIEAGASRAIPINVTASDAVQPGTYLLLFEIPISWMKSGSTQTDNIIASQEVEITVFGESEILTALAVPSFLLLPGMLALFTAKLVWFWGRKKPENGEFPLALLSQEFWVIAVSLSLVAALTYPFFTGELTGNRRDYLDGYGLMDIVRVWFGAVLLSILAVFGFNSLRRLYIWARARRQARAARALYVSTDDSEMATLYKLGRQKMSLILPQARFTPEGGAAAERVFVLGRAGEVKADHLVVGPSLTYRWLNNDSSTQRLIDAVNEVLGNPNGTISALEVLFRQGVASKALEVKWNTTGASIQKPTLVPEAQTVPAGTFTFVEAI